MNYLIIALILFVAEIAYFAIAKQAGIVDRPNERSSHHNVTLRGGGIIVFIATWVWAAFFGIDGHEFFLAALTIIATVSFIDDMNSVPVKVRLTLHFVAMLLLFGQLNLLHPANWLEVIIGLILCAGIINAYNFMDGINGITGAYTLAVLAPISILNHRLNFAPTSLIIVIAIAVGVFLFFNFRKRARCFCGDVGSVSIAFIVVFLLGSLIIATRDITYIMLLAVYGIDTVLTIIHRLMLHEHITQAHRKHAFQLLANELHLPHLAVSSFYAILQLAISIGLIYLPVNHYVYSAVVLLLLASAYVLLMRRYYHLHAEYLQSLKAKEQ